MAYNKKEWTLTTPITPEELNRMEQGIEDNDTAITEHINDTNNPHNVTAEQINTYEKQAIDNKVKTVQDDLDNHKNNKNNPHGTTADQVGAYTKEETDNKFVDKITYTQDKQEIEQSIDDIKEQIEEPSFIDLTIDEPVYHIEEATLDSPKEIQVIHGSSLPIISDEDLEIASYKINDALKNEIYTDEGGQKRIVENVGRVIIENPRITQYYNDGVAIYKPVNSLGYGNFSSLSNAYYIEGYEIKTNRSSESIYVLLKEGQTLEELQQELIGKPLYYELKVKNPKTKVIESSDLFIESDYVRMAKPVDFSGNSAGLLIGDYGLMDRIDRIDVTTSWIYVYPKDMAAAELGSQLVGKTLIYELAQPRLAKTEGIAGVVNPTIKDSNGHTLSLNGTYHKWDRAENRNGVWWDVIATNTAVIENPIDNGDYITIDKPSDLVSEIMIDGVESYIINETTIDLVTDLTIAELTGKEYIYNVTPTEKLSSVISKDDLDFSQGSTIYLESDTIALPKVDAKVAMDIAGQVDQLTKDSRSKSKKLHDHDQRIKANEIAINNLNTEVSDINQTIANEVEGRIEQLENDLQNTFVDVKYTISNGHLTFYRKDGTTKVIDLPLEMIIESGRFDEETNTIILTMANQQTIEIPVGAVVTDISEALHNVEEKLNLTQAEVNQLQTDVSQVQENVTNISNGLKAAIKDVDYTASNGHLTFTKGDGSQKTIDLPLELIVADGYLSEDNQTIVLELANSDVINIPVGALVTDLVNRMPKSLEDGVTLRISGLLNGATTSMFNQSSRTFTLESDIKIAFANITWSRGSGLEIVRTSYDEVTLRAVSTGESYLRADVVDVYGNKSYIRININVVDI